MKKASFIIAILAALLIASPAVHAAGSVTVTQYYLSLDKNVLVIKLDCTGDATNGSVPSTDIDAEDVSQGLGTAYYRAGFYIYDIWAIAGTGTAPDAADVTITDAQSRTLYDEDSIIPASGTNEGTVSVKAVISQLTVAHANQDTASGEWELYILLAR